MSILKGNFDTKKTVTAERPEETSGEKFEREALARLGGSIAFVSHKKFLWTGEDENEKEMPAEGRAEQYSAGRDAAE
jgi:hypothetical protein